ncbi:hypothetical protein [Bradyrhizobium sp. CCGE-LA001]|uniref:hypothetical protein n=1 Tax=Bradyrhizobium sp. CCGE-LA001 TaxID=1223566 RepID=UPI0002AA8500|nr:hypothetical protein [Bradyrhizobium sp. CCGE-LA001]AMA60050.1 hypothetical protein BCCGELA001_29970 [Bradyrhizobium sp. CCGE-LA001]
MNLDRMLQEIIPYRMYAVSALNLATSLGADADKPKAIQIYIDGKLRIEGNLFAFTNPAIEAGLVHCRALLEFLGLSAHRCGHIVNVDRRRPTDVGIENFSNASGALSMVRPEAALARYEGGKEEAEKALLAVFRITNKGIAHVTEDLLDNPEHGRLIEIASRGVPSLVVSYLYTPLGLPAPDYKLTHRTA